MMCYCLTWYNVLSVNDDIIVPVWSRLFMVQPECVTYEDKLDLAFEKKYKFKVIFPSL